MVKPSSIAVSVTSSVPTKPPWGEPYLRFGLAFFMVAIGIAHFTHGAQFLPAMPPYLLPRHHLLLIHVSGFFEILGGLGIALPAGGRTGFLRRAAGFGLIALYVAVFPANLYLATSQQAFLGAPNWAAWARLPFQLVLIGWAYRYARGG